MTERQISFLVGLRRIVLADVSPQMLLALVAIRSYPGSSYSDVADKLGHAIKAAVYKSVRHLMARGLVEDRRIITNPKTPGDLHATPAGIEFLKGVLDNVEAHGALPPRQ